MATPQDVYLIARLMPDAIKLAGLRSMGKLATMAAVGVATESIATDFRNPLTGEVWITRNRLLGEGAGERFPKFMAKKGSVLRPYFGPLPKKFKKTWKQIAADPSIPVFKTEGEFKTLALSSKGVPTIGITGKDCMTKDGKLIAGLELVVWKGRPVILVPDFDFTWKPDVRRSWIRNAAALDAIGAKVSIRLLQDVTGTGVCGLDDFLMARTREDFDALPLYPFNGPVCAKWREESGIGQASQLPDLKLEPIPAEWLSKKLPPMEYTVAGYVPRGTVVLLVGAGGFGKTFAAMELSVSVATGERWFGAETRAGKVVYVALEDPPSVLRRRLHQICERRLVGMRADVSKLVRQNLMVASLAGQQMHMVTLDRNVVVQTPAIDALVEKLRHEQVELLVLDPMARLHGLNENDNAVGTAFINSVERISREVGCSVLLLHHTGKAPANSKNGYGARGASGISDASRGGLLLTRLDDKDADQIANVTEEERNRLVLLRHEKSNYSALMPDLYLRRDDHGNLDPFVPQFKDSAAAPAIMADKLRAWFIAGGRAPFTTNQVVTSRASIFGDASPGKHRVSELLADLARCGVLAPSGTSVRGGTAFTFAQVANDE